MNDCQFTKLAGMLSEIAYEIHDNEYINENLRELFLDLWREFDHYNQKGSN